VADFDREPCCRAFGRSEYKQTMLHRRELQRDRRLVEISSSWLDYNWYRGYGVRAEWHATSVTWEGHPTLARDNVWIPAWVVIATRRLGMLDDAMRAIGRVASDPVAAQLAASCSDAALDRLIEGMRK